MYEIDQIYVLRRESQDILDFFGKIPGQKFQANPEPEKSRDPGIL